MTVVNQGKSGEEAPEELARMKRDVIEEHPALVIWQVGTNAVWQLGHNLDDVAAAITAGLTLLADWPIDVVLMDLQYVSGHAHRRQDRCDAAHVGDDHPGPPRQDLVVNVFHRFAMMQKWHEVEKYSFDTMIDPNDSKRLHQSYWSIQRVAFELSEAIAAAAARASVT